DFIEWDSVRTGFVRPYQATFIAVANQYRGELDATGLIRMQTVPSTVTYQNKSGVLVVDSMPDRLDGMLILRLDTAQLRQSALTEAEVALYEVAEEWDLATANWSYRIATDKV